MLFKEILTVDVTNQIDDQNHKGLKSISNLIDLQKNIYILTFLTVS